MSEERLSPDDERIVNLCNQIGPILSGQSICIVAAALSEMLAFGLSASLTMAEQAGPKQHEDAQSFVADFLKTHIRYIAEATGATVTVAPVSAGSDAIN